MAKSGAVVEPQQRQFLQTQGPVARKKSQKATQILRAGNILPSPRGNPRKRGSRGWAAWRQGRQRRSCRLRPPLGGSLVPFCPCRKELAAGAAKYPPAHNESNPKSVPSSAPFGGTFPYPLCRFATSPLDKGSRPPGGRLMRAGGEIPLQRLKPTSASNTSRYKTAHTERPPPACRYTRWCRRRRPPRGPGR